MCNYLTTPQMIVHSACLASCAIPGVFEAVELMAKNRDGEVVPYFKTGGWRWTDGGLQADLPKARLSELFNVNQFIVSQVNPLTPLFVPVDTGIPFVTETLLFLKRQLTGFVSGVSELGQGTFVRPNGLRLVDIVMQDYEGDVTIFPNWKLTELSQFVHNFDQQRMEAYELDGERAVWPRLPLIRSLCEIEFALDQIATELGEELALTRAVSDSTCRGGQGRLPSYAARLDQLASGGTGEAAPLPVSSSVRQHHGMIRATVPGSNSMPSLPAAPPLPKQTNSGNAGYVSGLGGPGGLGSHGGSQRSHSHDFSESSNASTLLATPSIPAVSSHASRLNLGFVNTERAVQSTTASVDMSEIAAALHYEMPFDM
jgi:TAG lipase/steryl ester hydrolase/phospholipase A2/LPA acyltransferase